MVRFWERFDELGIWKIFSIDLFQMLAVVCRLVISLQNIKYASFTSPIFSVSPSLRVF